MCISEDRVQEIITHEIAPMERDVAAIRKILFWAGGLIITGLFGVGVWVGTIQSAVSHVQNDQQRFEDRIEDRLVRIEQLLVSLSDKVSSTRSNN